MNSIAKILIIVGIILIFVGLLLPLLQRIGLGSLPGDIIIRKKNFTFYFPIVTCIIVSIVISLIVWLINRLH